ncbi:UPF0058 family protein [Natrialbaceae archaeon AArc-T1-2]|uniref:UPF0058 family protein n=1 Tax=Natrialbaceae archaeon AArc-T1-2 TaxID=3053904 RepID=UPI00255AA4AB|nr:UPF0058 family protein [Natrialbaceae archaeon AArc-T1-2]WIV68273.1 UPF0058 family protein [Natrialbaceae archaeon AArc-T1-2]
MRSQECVQLHALLQLLREHVEEHHHVGDAFDAYDRQPVRPVHVHRSKDDHRQAIGLLLEGIGDVIDERSREAPAVRA